MARGECSGATSSFEVGELVAASGIIVMFVDKGFVSFQPDLAPSEIPAGFVLDWPGNSDNPSQYPRVKLSVFRSRQGGHWEATAPDKFCAVHHTVLPASGVCDDCTQ